MEELHCYAVGHLSLLVHNNNAAETGAPEGTPERPPVLEEASPPKPEKAPVLEEASKESSAPNNAPTKLSPWDFEPPKQLRMGMSQRAFDKLKADIAKNGIQEPIKYVEYQGKKYIVDGYHRQRIAKQLGLKEVPAEKVELPYKGYNTIQDVLAE